MGHKHQAHRLLSVVVLLGVAACGGDDIADARDGARPGAIVDGGAVPSDGPRGGLGAPDVAGTDGSRTPADMGAAPDGPPNAADAAGAQSDATAGTSNDRWSALDRGGAPALPDGNHFPDLAPGQPCHDLANAAREAPEMVDPTPINTVPYTAGFLRTGLYEQELVTLWRPTGTPGPTGRKFRAAMRVSGDYGGVRPTPQQPARIDLTWSSSDRPDEIRVSFLSWNGNDSLELRPVCGDVAAISHLAGITSAKLATGLDVFWIRIGAMTAADRGVIQRWQRVGDLPK